MTQVCIRRPVHLFLYFGLVDVSGIVVVSSTNRVYLSHYGVGSDVWLFFSLKDENIYYIGQRIAFFNCYKMGFFLVAIIFYSSNQYSADIARTSFRSACRGHF